MTITSIRGVSLFVKVIGQGYPLVLMHGGPGLDHTSLRALQPLADQFTLIFYDHRCNGRSEGAKVSSMTFENLTADADALRQTLGFDRWAVLGHSFGGQVALEYALRYPQSLSHLILMDTGGDQWWVQHNAPELLESRGFSSAAVQAARRFFSGQLAPKEFFPVSMKYARAYYYNSSRWAMVRGAISGFDLKARPEATIFGYGQLLPGWTVMDRLSEIEAPTLVMAGRDDFLFPPEHQAALAGGIPDAQLEMIERAGHEAPSERPVAVVRAVRNFLGSSTAGAGPGVDKSTAKTRPAGPSTRRASYDAVEAYIERGMRRLKLPGVSLAIVEGDQIVHRRGFGRARPGGEAPTPQTPFFIGSLTKSVTALAVMQLVEAGKVELDAPVQRYLPWFRVADPKASAQMTVRHLLNQTSGLPESAGEAEMADFDDRPGATERQVRALASLKLARPVGSACQYSNMNYNSLGLIIEAASGQSYADYVQEHIFAPLDMNHTYTSPAVARQNGLAMGHRYWFGFPFPAPNLPTPHGSLPSGQLISTAEDLARYLIAHMNDGRYGQARILSAAGINELHRGAVEYSKMGVSAGKYAMGWFDGEIGQTRIVWHGGTVPDFEAYMAILPEQKKGVVLLFNACHWWFNPVLTEFSMDVVALLASEHYSPTPFSSVIPWMLRGQLLIPALQVADVVATLRLLRRWRLEPERRPSAKRKWGLYLLLPLIPNLLVALTLRSMLGKRRAYLKFIMPDYSWLAMICGSLALAWSFLRTGLVLRALLGPSSPAPVDERRRTGPGG